MARASALEGDALQGVGGLAVSIVHRHGRGPQQLHALGNLQDKDEDRLAARVSPSEVVFPQKGYLDGA